MNTSTGEIRRLQDAEIKAMDEKERKQWIRLKVTPAELETLEKMRPHQRMDWWTTREEAKKRLAQQLNPNSKHGQKRAIAFKGRGMTRKELRAAGLHIRPKVARLWNPL